MCVFQGEKSAEGAEEGKESLEHPSNESEVRPNSESCRQGYLLGFQT